MKNSVVRIPAARQPVMPLHRRVIVDRSRNRVRLQKRGYFNNRLAVHQLTDTGRVAVAVMTPEETKTHVERQLNELGWTARIGDAGYEKLSRFSASNAVGISQLCHKLVSLGALQQHREIDEEVLEMAMLDLSRAGGDAHPTTRSRSGDGHEVDWTSIEQLAAVLETKVAAGELEPEVRAPPRTAPGNGARRTGSAPAARAPSKAASQNYPNGTANQGARPKAAASAEPRGTGRARAAKTAPVAVLTAERRYETAPRRDPAPATPSRNRVSSTVAITMTATMLLVLAIAAIWYVNQETGNFEVVPPPSATGSIPDGPPAIAEEHGTGAAGDGETGAAPAPPQSVPFTADAETEVERETSPPLIAKSAPPAALADKSNETPPESRTEEGEAGTAAANAAAPKESPDRPAQSAPAPATERQPESAPPKTTASEEAATAAPVPKPRAAAPERGPAAVPSAPRTPAVRNEAAETAAADAEADHDTAETASSREDVALAKPAPAAAPPPLAEQGARVAVNRISRDELATFVNRFASVYEAGDLEQFMGLFAENARTNDRDGRNGIRVDYESLFRTTDLRRMKLGEINWEVDGNQAHGWGEFDVTVRRQGDKEPYLYTGSLSFVVEKVDGRLRIVRLYHGQQRVES